MEAKTGSIIPTSKFWFKSGGGYVPLDPGLFVHHIHAPVNYPEKFGMTEDDILAMDPVENLSDLKSGAKVWDNRINNQMNKRGHFRGHYKFTTGGKLPPHHNFTLSDDRAWLSRSFDPKNLDDYADHIRHLSSSIPEGHNATLEIETRTKGFDKDFLDNLKNKYGAVVDDERVTFYNKSNIDSFLSDTQSKKTRDVKPEAPNVTGQDVRAALGKKPEAMTGAEWNFFRTIGDSYNTKSFNNFLSEYHKKIIIQ